MKKILPIALWILIVGQFTSCKNQECPPPETHEVVITGNRYVADAGINSTGIMIDKNFGADDRLQAGAWTWSGIHGTMRSFLKFNFSSLPLNADILKAELVLYADTTIALGPDWLGHQPADGPNDWRIERVLSSWEEDDITWTNQPETDDSDPVMMPASTYPAETFKADITKLIKSQYLHPEQNFGIMFRTNDETHYRSLGFCSTEHVYSKLAPKLIITYSH